MDNLTSYLYGKVLMIVKFSISDKSGGIPQKVQPSSNTFYIPGKMKVIGWR